MCRVLIFLAAEKTFRPKVYASLSRSGAKRSTRGSDWLAMSDFDKSRRYKAQAKRWGRLLPKSALSPFGHLSRIDWHVRLELAVLAVDRPCGTRSAYLRGARRTLWRILRIPASGFPLCLHQIYPIMSSPPKVIRLPVPNNWLDEC